MNNEQFDVIFYRSFTYINIRSKIYKIQCKVTDLTFYAHISCFIHQRNYNICDMNKN